MKMAIGVYYHALYFISFASIREKRKEQASWKCTTLQEEVEMDFEFN